MTERLLDLRSIPDSRDSCRSFIGALDDPSHEVVRLALKRLANLGGESEAVQLRERMLDADISLVPDFAAALATLGDEQSEEMATEALGDASPSRRMAAARALQSLGRHGAKPALRQALGDAHAAVRRWSLEALHAIGVDDEDWQASRDALVDPDPQVRAAAVNAVARFGPRAREALTELVADEAPVVRRAVARRIGFLAREAGDALLFDRERSVREAAIGGAGTAHLNAVERVLAGDPIDELRASAVRKLAELGADPSALVGALADKSALVRIAAHEALDELLGRQRMIGVLLERLPEAPPRLRLGIVHSLERLGSVEAGGALCALCQDPDPEVRVALAHCAARIYGARSPILECLENDPDAGVRNAVTVVRQRPGPGES